MPYGKFLLLLIILTANGFSPGGSGTTIRHNTQNNTTIKRNAVHKVKANQNTLKIFSFHFQQTCWIFVVNINGLLMLRKVADVNPENETKPISKLGV
jgi:hypothetical protein